MQNQSIPHATKAWSFHYFPTLMKPAPRPSALLREPKPTGLTQAQLRAIIIEQLG